MYSNKAKIIDKRIAKIDKIINIFLVIIKPY